MRKGVCMALLTCCACGGDGFTEHYVKNESIKTICYFTRRCVCDSGTGNLLAVRGGEEVIDGEIFRKLEAEGYRRVHKGRSEA